MIISLTFRRGRRGRRSSRRGRRNSSRRGRRGKRSSSSRRGQGGRWGSCRTVPPLHDPPNKRGSRRGWRGSRVLFLWVHPLLLLPAIPPLPFPLFNSQGRPPPDEGAVVILLLLLDPPRSCCFPWPATCICVQHGFQSQMETSRAVDG